MKKFHNNTKPRQTPGVFGYTSNIRFPKRRGLDSEYFPLVFVVSITFILHLCSAALFYYNIYDPRYFPKACENSYLFDWSTYEFRHLCVISSFLLIILIFGYKCMKKGKNDNLGVLEGICLFFLQIFGFSHLVLWIGLWNAYIKTQEYCGSLASVVYVFQIVLTIFFSLVFLIFCIGISRKKGYHSNKFEYAEGFAAIFKKIFTR